MVTVDPKNRQALAARVAKAAADYLEKYGSVSAIDVMIGIGWLNASHVVDWRSRRIPYLERCIHSNLKRISVAMRQFAAWAKNGRPAPGPDQLRRAHGSTRAAAVLEVRRARHRAGLADDLGVAQTVGSQTRTRRGEGEQGT